MTRNKVLTLVSILGLALLYLVFRPVEAEEPAVAPKVEAPRLAPKSTQSPPTKIATNKRGKRDAETLYDDDPVGALRLEGQVITTDDLSVAGAIVSIDSRPPRFVKSEEDGSFAFDALVGKTYRLVARSKEGVAGPVRAELSESNEPVILTLNSGGEIQVSILSASDSKALAGAQVELRGIDTQAAISDAEGKAVFQQVPVGRYRVVAKAEGFTSTRSQVSISRSGAKAEVELALKGGARVAGIVVDPEGKPLPGARVAYQGVSDRSVRATPRLDGVTSDKEGRFAIAALPAGSFRFTATADGFAPGFSELITLDGDSETTGVEVRMESGATLRGKVHDKSGTPVAGARVRVSVKSAGMRRGRSEVRQAFSDDKGHYEITGLRRKAHDVVAMHESASSQIVDTDLSADPYLVELDLELDVSGVIAGIVVDSNDEPIAGAQVSLFPDFRKGARRSSAEWRLRGMSTALTDSGGLFRVGGLQPGEDYRVRATPATSTSRGRAWLTEGVEATTGDEKVRVVIPADGGIKGKVAFANGEAPASFTVSVGWRNGTPFASKKGTFTLGDLPPQTFTVSVKGANFDPVRVADVVVVEGKHTDLGTITVKQGRKVTGRVVDGNQAAVSGASVSAGRVIAGDGSGTSTGGRGHPLARSTKTTTSDENGEFAIYGVGLGDLSIVADHETLGRSLAVTVQLSNDSVENVSLALLPVGSLEGVVRRSGVTEADVSVTASSVRAPSVTFSVATGPDGKYRFDRLAPDSYQVKARFGGNPMSGMSFFSKLVEVTPDARTELDIELSPGNTTLTVTLVAEAELGFSRISVVPGVVQVASARELESLLGEGAGFEGMSMSIRGQPAKATGLSVGSYSVCATVYPSQIEGFGGVMDYMKREGDNLAVHCQPVKIGEQPEQSMSMQVVVPEFVPEPSDTPTP